MYVFQEEKKKSYCVSSIAEYSFTAEMVISTSSDLGAAGLSASFSEFSVTLVTQV